MAQSDVNLIFSSAQSLVGSGTIASTGVLDLAEGAMLTGSTYDNPAPGLKIGNATVFGEDLGIGRQRVKMGVWLGTAFAGGTSLNIAWQGAVDNQGGTIGGLTWVTYAESGAQLTAKLTANTPFPMPDYPYDAIGQSNPMPRFIRLAYILGGTMSAGTIATAGMVLSMSLNRIANYPSGFAVGA